VYQSEGRDGWRGDHPDSDGEDGERSGRIRCERSGGGYDHDRGRGHLPGGSKWLPVAITVLVLGAALFVGSRVHKVRRAKMRALQAELAESRRVGGGDGGRAIRASSFERGGGRRSSWVLPAGIEMTEATVIQGVALLPDDNGGLDLGLGGAGTQGLHLHLQSQQQQQQQQQQPPQQQPQHPQHGKVGGGRSIPVATMASMVSRDPLPGMHSNQKGEGGRRTSIEASMDSMGLPPMPHRTANHAQPKDGGTEYAVALQ